MDTESKNRIVKMLCILAGVVLAVVMGLCILAAVRKGKTNDNETNGQVTESAQITQGTEETSVKTETNSDTNEETVTGETAAVTTEESAETSDAVSGTYPVNPADSVIGRRLCEKFQNDFYVGVCVGYSTLSDETAVKLIKEQFNSVTFENEMKPDVLLNRTASIVNGELTVVWPKKTIEMLDWARDNGLAVRGHTLVWYSQTPDWIFYEDFDTKKNLVDREEMLKRMESMIRQEMEYINENYPDLIYAWDVVNEAFDDAGGLRDNYWHQIIGDDYIEMAFTYARKYAGNYKLFLNDYNSYMGSKSTTMYKVAKELAEKGLIDGVGMQSHLDVGYPTASLFVSTAKKFAALGVEVEITEMDITTTDTSDAGLEKQAQMYGDIFSQLVELDRAGEINFTSATIWGLTDQKSWRAAKLPTLFTADYKPKASYEAIWNIE